MKKKFPLPPFAVERTSSMHLSFHRDSKNIISKPTFVHLGSEYTWKSHCNSATSFSLMAAEEQKRSYEGSKVSRRQRNEEEKEKEVASMKRKGSKHGFVLSFW